MKRIAVLLALAIPAVSHADYVDVVALKMRDGCNMATVAQVAKDLSDTWGKDFGYRAEILVPVQSQSADVFYWVGRTSNGEAFGKAMDSWSSTLDDANTTGGKLAARLLKCVQVQSRSGFLTR